MIINEKNSRSRGYGKPTIAINKSGTFLINKQAATALELSEGTRVAIKKEKKLCYICKDPEGGFPLKIDANGMLRFSSLKAAMAVIGKRPESTHRFNVDPQTFEITKA